MKSYQSIGKKYSNKETYYFFDKLDGSNIRAEWSKKKGFYKFGSRTQLIDTNHPVFSDAVEKIKSIEHIFNEIAKEEKYERFVAFFEFFGENSFAGTHVNGEKKKVVLFDVSVYKKGYVPPKEFIDIFKDRVEIPDLLYVGKPTNAFIESVKDGSLTGMTFEGVIGKNANKNVKHNAFFKCKNIQWIFKLKGFCNEDMKLFNLLK